MTPFKGYEKVERWDHEADIAGIERGVVHVQEKIDGANGQVCLHDGHIVVAGKTRVLARCKRGNPEEIEDSFRGFPHSIFNSPCYFDLLMDPTFTHWRLYGEWLVKHTVNYDPKYMNTFWVFDVYDDVAHRYLEYKDYQPVLEKFGLPYIREIMVLDNPSFNDLLDLVRKDEQRPNSGFGAERIEGLVFKNYQFINRFGNNLYMKIVTKEFREVHHAVMGATRRDDVELQLVAKYLQPPRMEKMYQKLLDAVSQVPTMADVPQFMGMVYHDLLTEDAWQMFAHDKLVRRSRGVVDFTLLKRYSDMKARNWFVCRLQERV